jgi:hypothetical protein
MIKKTQHVLPGIPHYRNGATGTVAGLGEDWALPAGGALGLVASSGVNQLYSSSIRHSGDSGAAKYFGSSCHFRSASWTDFPPTAVIETMDRFGC